MLVASILLVERVKIIFINNFGIWDIKVNIRELDRES